MFYCIIVLSELESLTSPQKFPACGYAPEALRHVIYADACDRSLLVSDAVFLMCTCLLDFAAVKLWKFYVSILVLWKTWTCNNDPIEDWSCRCK